MSQNPIHRFLDHGEVQRIDHNNDDLTVVNAARVSTGKFAVAFDHERDSKLIKYLADNDHWTPFGHCRYGFIVLVTEHNFADFLVFLASDRGAGFEIDTPSPLKKGSTKCFVMTLTGSLYGWLVGKPPVLALDEAFSLLYKQAPVATEALLGFIPKESEETMYGMAASLHTTLRIKLPIFVARQLMRSNVGIVYNEVSRRYVDDPVEIHRPTVWRGRPEKGIKQGSGHPIAYTPTRWQCGAFDIGDAENAAKEEYQRRIAAGVAPEQARTCLPLSTYTELWATFTPSALKRVLSLRSSNDQKNHAQLEIRELAAAMRLAEEGER